MICANSKKAVKRLNESASKGGNIILEGPFSGPLDGRTTNRNGRIYTKEEYLKHLQYLRDDLKKGEPLLGELDHPEDRFEVKMKEASHRILDIWYDNVQNCIMGKIELLPTPNGKIASALVESGIPLHISSRAAGTVNADNTVSIQQIYTYDLVAKPGFAEAVLHRVNESETADKYSDVVTTFLTESEKAAAGNTASEYGFLNEDVTITDLKAEVVLRPEAKEIQENMKTIEDKTIVNEAEENETQETPVTEADDNKEEKTEETGEDNKDEKDTEDKGVEILDVRAVTSDIEIKDVEAEYGDSDEKNDDESDDSDESDKDDEKEDETSECADSEDKKEDKATEKNILNDCNNDDVKCRREKFEDKFAEFVDSYKKKKKDECVKESVYNTYPMSISLDESNFAEFLSLDESQKNNVIAYLRDNEIVGNAAINENWKAGLDYVASEPAWLKYAPAYYKGLYESAPADVKKSIKYTAEFVLFESQDDINNFWYNSGLVSSSERNVINEQFVNNMPKIAEINESTNLPYGKNFIDMIADMACEYN